jgi:cyclopropane fatty-acyl-phospholipid synthase-like methyltransferase
MELLARFFSLVVLLAVLVFFVVSIWTWTPYVPTSSERVEVMRKLARLKPGDRMADLGSGDGRILIAFAKEGFEAHGYELNPILVWWSRLRIAFAGLSGKAFVHMGDFWKEDFTRFDVVTLYCMQRVMPEFEEKFRKELKPGARVLSHKFSFPTWQPAETEGKISLYIK